MRGKYVQTKLLRELYEASRCTAHSSWCWKRKARNLNSNESFKQWVCKRVPDHPKDARSYPDVPPEHQGDCLDIRKKLGWGSVERCEEPSARPKKNRHQDLQGAGCSCLHTQRELRWITGDLPGQRQSLGMLTNVWHQKHPMTSEMATQTCGGEDLLLKSSRQSPSTSTHFCLLFLRLWLGSFVVESLSSRGTGSYWCHKFCAREAKVLS